MGLQAASGPDPTAVGDAGFAGGHKAIIDLGIGAGDDDKVRHAVSRVVGLDDGCVLDVGQAFQEDECFVESFGCAVLQQKTLWVQILDPGACLTGVRGGACSLWTWP